VIGGIWYYSARKFIFSPEVKQISLPSSSTIAIATNSTTLQDTSALGTVVISTSTAARFPVYPFISPDLITQPGYTTFNDGTSSYSFDSAAPGPPPPWNFRGPTGVPPYGVITQLGFNGGIMSDLFSADHQYVAFETRNRLSSSSVQFSLIVVQLTGGNTTFIQLGTRFV